MNAFFVGQRVRVKCGAVTDARTFSLIGQEARIIGEETIGAVDRWLLDKYQCGSQLFCRKDCAGVYLEPILGDDHKACDDDFKRDLDRLLDRQGIAA